MRDFQTQSILHRLQPNAWTVFDEMSLLQMHLLWNIDSELRWWFLLKAAWEQNCASSVRRHPRCRLISVRRRLLSSWLHVEHLHEMSIHQFPELSDCCCSSRWIAGVYIHMSVKIPQRLNIYLKLSLYFQRSWVETWTLLLLQSSWSTGPCKVSFSPLWGIFWLFIPLWFTSPLFLCSWKAAASSACNVK